MPRVSLSRYDLYNKDAEAEHIQFRGVLSTHHVLRRHVATAMTRISTMVSFDSTVCLNGRLNRMVNKLTMIGYNVPTMRFVISRVWSCPKSLARPKSPILGFMSASNKILLAFMSRWTIFFWESSWRYCNPRATPSIMLNLFLQSSRPFSSGSNRIRILWPMMKMQSC